MGWSLVSSMPTDLALPVWLRERMLAVMRLWAGTVRVRVLAPWAEAAWGARRMVTWAGLVEGLSRVRYSWKVTPV